MNKGATIVKKISRALLPLTLGAAILWWIYRDFDFSAAWKAASGGMSWTWMGISLVFGTLAHIARGMRWKMALEPLGQHPRASNCINAVFLSYGASLIIPRSGEVARCGVLSKYDKVPFGMSLGTVVTERIVDTAVSLLNALAALLVGGGIIMKYFEQTGISSSFMDIHPGKILIVGTSAGLILTAVVLFLAFRRISKTGRIRKFLTDIWDGVRSLRGTGRAGSYARYTAIIWLCYFLQFYTTLPAFSFTASLGLPEALLLFVAGTFAVVVPTPNGAGPWHFAIITMMAFMGINQGEAAIFALIVHAIQTFLLILLGIYAVAALPAANN